MAYCDDAARLLYEEIDYENEGRNAERFREAMVPSGKGAAKVLIRLFMYIYISIVIDIDIYIYLHIPIYTYTYIYIYLYIGLRVGQRRAIQGGDGSSG